jgi:hypothetical protein
MWYIIIVRTSMGPTGHHQERRSHEEAAVILTSITVPSFVHQVRLFHTVSILSNSMLLLHYPNEFLHLTTPYLDPYRTASHPLYHMSSSAPRNLYHSCHRRLMRSYCCIIRDQQIRSFRILFLYIISSYYPNVFYDSLNSQSTPQHHDPHCIIVGSLGVQ